MNNPGTEDNQGIIGVISERLLNGILKENPTFVLLLGMCPTLAVTTSAVNGLGMGVTTMVVLTMSNFIISALRKVIPNKIRIPAFIVIIASFVTIVELLLKAYIPSLYDSLGLYIPLIVVNCIILGRAESYAYSHAVLPSLFDGLGMGMGFSIALTIIGALRELLGAGKIFGHYVMPEGFVPVSIFIMAPGAFFVLALLTAIQNKIKEIGAKRGIDVSKIQSGCGGNCLECDRDCKKDMSMEEPVNEPFETQEEPAQIEEPIQTEEEIEYLPKEKKTITEKFKTDKIKNLVKGISFKKSDKIGADENPNTEEDNKAEIIGETFEETLEIIEEPVEIIEEAVSFIKEPVEIIEEEVSVIEKSVDLPTEEIFEPVSEVENSLDSDLELLDLDDYRDAIKKNQASGKKPQRKKSSRAKAQALLTAAEETEKEDKDND